MMGYYSALVVPVCDMKIATNCFNGQKQPVFGEYPAKQFN